MDRGTEGIQTPQSAPRLSQNENIDAVQLRYGSKNWQRQRRIEYSNLIHSVVIVLISEIAHSIPPSHHTVWNLCKTLVNDSEFGFISVLSHI